MAKGTTGKIKFLRAYTVKDETRTHYKQGDVVALPLPSCDHFVRRNLAEWVAEREAATVETPAKAVVEPPAKK